MAEIYMYADETGNLDYDVSSGKQGASRYFGFGTAVFDREHGKELWDGLALRARLEERGVNLPRCFHAKNDTPATKTEMFDLIGAQRPRFDLTFLLKENAYPAVRARGEMELYRMAWYLHLKEIAKQVADEDDTLYAIVSSFGTHARATAARDAIRDVCDQVNRRIVLCAGTVQRRGGYRWPTTGSGPRSACWKAGSAGGGSRA